MANIGGYNLSIFGEDFRDIFKNPTLNIKDNTITTDRYGRQSMEFHFAYTDTTTNQSVQGGASVTLNDWTVLNQIKTQAKDPYPKLQDPYKPPVVEYPKIPLPIVEEPIIEDTGQSEKVQEVSTSIWSRLKGHVSNFIIGAMSPIDSLVALHELSQSEIEAVRTELQAKVQAEELEQTQQDVAHSEEMERLRIELDLLNESILEKIGLFQSDEEKRIQAEMLRQEFYRTYATQIPQTALTYADLQKVMAENPIYIEASEYQLPQPIEIIFPEDKTGAFLSAVPWAIAGISIVGLLISRKK